MDRETVIEAVTVNHGTSAFVELMLRTLYRHNDTDAFGFRVTVLDNNSKDEHAGELKSFLEERGIPLARTGFNDGIRPETHGEALSRFVLENPQCTHYMFLDSDMWFTEEGTIATMLAELDDAPDVFAVQARVFGFYAGRVIEGEDGRVGASDAEGLTLQMRFESRSCFESRSYDTSIAFRCSPACCMVENHPVFRQVVEAFGLGRAFLPGVHQAKFYDTFGLMTHAMSAYGLRHVISAKTVNHFTETANRPEFRGARDRDCLRLLREMRTS